MRRRSYGLLLMLPFSVLLFAIEAGAFQYWNDIRHSAMFPDDTLLVRTENPSGGEAENYLLYRDAGIVEALMSSVQDGPSTLQTLVPGPAASPRYYGFRLLQGSELDLMPVRIADGAAPSPQDLTRVATDAAGDEAFGYTNLDLVDCHVSFSGTEFFASLTNAGGGFPVSGGLGFFGYLLGIADPAQADPDTVFALMYTYEQAGIITPGLYKVMGTGLGDLEKIGEVAVQEYPATNTLMLSCQLADLMSDPYFQSWYDATDPTVGVAAFTQRITLLGGAQEADRSPGGRCALREFVIAPGPNTLPTLADHAFEGSGATATARIDYTDTDGHCPVSAEIVFDGVDPYPLYPQTLDYSAAVTYATEAGIPPLVSGSWTTAVFRFSDDLTNFVEYEAPATSVGEDAVSRLALEIGSRPPAGSATVALLAPATGQANVVIYDVRGARVRELLDGPVQAGRNELTWDGRTDRGVRTSSGVYFIRAACGSEEVGGKLVLIR